MSNIQDYFVEGRYILNAGIFLHEFLHEIQNTKIVAVFFKVHFEKLLMSCTNHLYNEFLL